MYTADRRSGELSEPRLMCASAPARYEVLRFEPVPGMGAAMPPIGVKVEKVVGQAFAAASTPRRTRDTSELSRSFVYVMCAYTPGESKASPAPALLVNAD